MKKLHCDFWLVEQNLVRGQSGSATLSSCSSKEHENVVCQYTQSGLDMDLCENIWWFIFLVELHCTSLMVYLFCFIFLSKILKMGHESMIFICRGKNRNRTYQKILLKEILIRPSYDKYNGKDMALCNEFVFMTNKTLVTSTLSIWRAYHWKRMSQWCLLINWTDGKLILLCIHTWQDYELFCSKGALNAMYLT